MLHGWPHRSPVGSTRPRLPLRHAVAVACTLAALVLPPEAAAQKDPFIDALVAFRAALAGTYGDEGPHVTAALDRMAASLAVWDREGATAEAELRAGLAEASPDQALRRRIALASLWLDRSRWAAALAELDAALTIAPGRADLHLLRGLVREAAGDPAEAVQAFQRAWTLDRGDAIKAYLLAARGLAQGTLEDPQPPIDSLLAALHAAAAGQAPPAFIEVGLIQDSADWPVFAPAAYAAGFDLVARGRYGEALASFRAAAVQDPLLVDPAVKTADLARGIASLRKQRFEAAIAHLEAAVAAAPALSEAHRLLGVAYRADRRVAESLPHLETAVRLAPRDERARLALARTLMTAERWEDTEQALNDTTAALPWSGEARWLLAQVHTQRGRGLEAVGELEAAAACPLLAGRGQLYVQMAEIHQRHHDFHAMTRVLTERARLDPNNPVAHKQLGLVHLQRGSRQEALVELLVTALFAPRDPGTLATIGQIHLDAGRYEAAEAVLRRAVALAPDLRQARYALGTTLLRLGRTAEGEEQIAEFERLRHAAFEAQRREFRFEALLRDAQRHTREGRLEEAVAALEQAAAIVADDPRVFEQLASAYAKLGRAEDRARAEAAYRRLLQEGSAAPAPAR